MTPEEAADDWTWPLAAMEEIISLLRESPTAPGNGAEEERSSP